MTRAEGGSTERPVIWDFGMEFDAFNTFALRPVVFCAPALGLGGVYNVSVSESVGRELWGPSES
jgi:hypothetical protein